MANNNKFILRKHQQEAYDFIKTRSSKGYGGLISLEMGAGKTAIALKIISEATKNQKLSLYVCTASLIDEVEDQAKQHFPELAGSDEFMIYSQDRSDLSQVHETGVGNLFVIVSYSTLTSLFTNTELEAPANKPGEPLSNFVGDFPYSTHWDYVFFDESQRLRDTSRLSYQAAISLCSRSNWCMSGTLLINSGSDSLGQFKVSGMITSPDYEDILPREFLRYKKKAMVSPAFDPNTTLKPLVTEKIGLTFYPKNKKIYKACYDEYSKTSNRGARVDFLGYITAMKQICIHPYTLTTGKRNTFDPEGDGDIFRSKKLTKTIELLEKADSSDVFVVFSEYKAPLRMLKNYFGERALVVSGDLSKRKVSENISLFKRGKKKILLTTYKSCGKGHNFFMANKVILLSPLWNTASMKQAIARVWRSGQKRQVTVYELVYKGTIDTSLAAYSDQKQEAIEDFEEGRDNHKLKECLRGANICLSKDEDGGAQVRYQDLEDVETFEDEESELELKEEKRKRGVKVRSAKKKRGGKVKSERGKRKPVRVKKKSTRVQKKRVIVESKEATKKALKEQTKTKVLCVIDQDGQETEGATDQELDDIMKDLGF